MIIAIDGPAGSGKSTIAKLVSIRLGARNLDTGAMYRAVTLRALQQGYLMDPHRGHENNVTGIIEIARTEPITFRYDATGEISAVLIGDTDVTSDIRTTLIDANVSYVAAIPEVRAALTDQQRTWASGQFSVLEGRDIGTVVFPDAELKVFLTARPEIRAVRRATQNIAAPENECDPQILLDRIIQRDELDSSRDAAPLVAAKDAIIIDTSELSIDQVVDKIVRLVRERN
jgi:CMP/dCMP kinase